ncbi:hypothetical protein B0T11DRAFT_300197 [Plectosphaerella cucumerina]|uniref:Uncharacterized protein n=1 Tax=Plectosphaerella cucumerina TaxID=40658 RepID=A0A8K0TC90_9PEZI|nr:hypothetical protein B0T11DRAFT_300197 [Plectosphaerella cucumerina]
MPLEKAELAAEERAIDHDPLQSPTLSKGPSEEQQRKPSLLERVIAVPEKWYYLWEVIGLVFSAAAIVAICVVVKEFNGKPLPHWSITLPGRQDDFRLTLNALLSILSVFGSTCAMIPITKGVSQLKYIWFIEQDRNLADLEVFDAASRGKLGSAMLIWKLRFKHLAVLGGLASLLALAYGPFVQNLIDTSIEYRDAGKDFPAKVSWISFFSDDDWENGTTIDHTMKYSIKSAIAVEDDEWLMPKHFCPTGNCKWPAYYTLAACSMCTDISDLLNRTCSPPESGAINDGVATETVQSIMGFDPSQMPNNDSWMEHLELGPYFVTEDSLIKARECVIVPCVQKQVFELFKENTTADDLARSMQDDPSLPYPWMGIDMEWLDASREIDNQGNPYIAVNFTKNNTLPSQMSDNQKHHWVGAGIEESAHNRIKDYASKIFTGYVYSAQANGSLPEEHMSITESDDNFMAYDILYNTHTGRWTGPYCDHSIPTSNDLECAVHNAAAGITNAMRTYTWNVRHVNRAVHVGTSLAPVQVCSAQWQYISAPVAVWVLGMALFIDVVWKTRRANIKAWRTSPLAMLLLRLDPDSREQLKGWQNMGEAELRQTADELRLRLQIDQEGPPRFVRNEGEASGTSGGASRV